MLRSTALAPHLLMLILTFVFCLVLPACAQDGGMRAQIQMALNESAQFFNEDNYFMGVSKAKDACTMLHSAPGAMPETTWAAVAGKTVGQVMAKVKESEARHDVPNTTRRATALQQFLPVLIAWDPQNPRWHYENGVLYRALSRTMNDQYPQHIQAAISEFNQTLAIGGGGPYRAAAQQQLSSLQALAAKRGVEIRQFQSTHPLHNSANKPRPNNPDEAICGNCGRSYPAGWRCPYCGR